MNPLKLLLASACFSSLGFFVWRGFMVVALVFALLYAYAMAKLMRELVKHV